MLKMIEFMKKVTVGQEEEVVVVEVVVESTTVSSFLSDKADAFSWLAL